MPFVLCLANPLPRAPKKKKKTGPPFAACLPLHFVGLVAPPEAKGRREVAGEVVDLLDVCDEGLVDRLLRLNAGAADLLLL
jgi:hypothetical protein